MGQEKKIFTKDLYQRRPLLTQFSQSKADPSIRGCISRKKSRQSQEGKCLDQLADTNLSAFIWSVADLLRGDYKQSDYGKVILPFTVLRRLDCVLEPTKADVQEE